MNLLDEHETWMRSWGARDRTVEARLTIVRARMKAWGEPHTWARSQVEMWLAGPDLRSPWTRSTYYSHVSAYQKIGHKYGTVIAVPLRGKNERFIGVVALDGPPGLQDELSDPRVLEAVSRAASHVSELLT